jgi:hypothetical protein
LRSPTLQSAGARHKGRFAARRIYRKLARREGSGSLRRITAFVRHENVVRLLDPEPSGFTGSPWRAAKPGSSGMK